MTEAPRGHHIDVNDHGPSLKSLSFVTRNGEDATTGVLSPGEIKIVPTDRKEMLFLSKLGGDLKVTLPGMAEGVIYPAGSPVMLPANTQGIQLEAIGSQVSYECLYIPHEEKRAIGEEDAGVGTAPAPTSMAQDTEQAVKAATGSTPEYPFPGAIG